MTPVLHDPETLVLGYHNVTPAGTPAELLEAVLAVSSDRFAVQLRYLQRRYEMTGFDEITAARPGRPALVLTFDDGYEAVAEHVLPLLEPARVPLYLFINPAFVGGWNPRDKLMGLSLYGSAEAVRAVEAFTGAPIGTGTVGARAQRFVAARAPMWEAMRRQADADSEIEQLFARHADERVHAGLRGSRLLSWEQLAGLRARGVRIGNHGLHHLELDALPREQIRAEIREAQRAICDHLGGEEPVISYPRGKTNATVQAEAAAAGYHWGLGTRPGRIVGEQPSLDAPRVLVSTDGGLTGLLWKSSKVRVWLRDRVRRGDRNRARGRRPALSRRAEGDEGVREDGDVRVRGSGTAR